MQRIAVSMALALVAHVLLPAPVSAAKWGKTDEQSDEEEVDHVELAAILIQDGHYDRAAVVLSEVNPETDEDLDLPRYHMLSGLVALETGLDKQAAESFRKSIEAGQEDPVVHVFLAQALFGLESFPDTLAALDDAGEAADRLPGTFLIRAQCHWRTDDRVSAWAALTAGLERHPGTVELMRHRVMLLIDMGLFIQALEEGQDLLVHSGTGAEDYVAIAEALRRGKQLEKAAHVLEEARLVYPGNEMILKQLAQTYLDLEMPLAGARILHEAARYNPELTVEVAELYRRAGKLLMALYMNAEVADQPSKIKQRLGLLIELERYEEAASLSARLSRLGLLEDQAILYAVAYSFYSIGEHAQAEAYIKRITDPVFYDKGVELRRAIEACRQSGWQCM
jgi:hypothetical protein